MTAAEWLARARAVTDGATPGPWWREGDNEYVYGMARGGRPNGEGIAQARYYGDVRPNSRADAAFIAASRAMLPAAVAAIEAVLTLHVPVWNCGGNGYHCDECGTDLTDATPDCPTVRAITDHLDPA